MATKTKDDIARSVAKRTGWTIAKSKQAVDAVLAEIADAAMECWRVELRGFGVFTTKSTEERWARNPQTGEPVKVPGKRRVVFRPGTFLREEKK